MRQEIEVHICYFQALGTTDGTAQQNGTPLIPDNHHLDNVLVRVYIFFSQTDRKLILWDRETCFPSS